MRSTFRRRLTGTYLLVTILALLLTGILLAIITRNHTYESLESTLIYEAVLVGEMIDYWNGQGDPQPFLQEVCERASRDTDNRVTIIAADGTVLGDSSYNPAIMEPHGNRPEFFTALKGETGQDIRMSETAQVRMLYVAVPVHAGQFSGAVRLSKPLTSVEALYHRLLYVVLLMIIIVGIITVLLDISLAGKLSRPIGEITEVVREMAAGNLKRRLPHHSRDELGVLAGAINHMAQHLDQTIYEISTVKNRLEALLNHTINGIIMVAASGQITYANPMALAMLGLESEAVGRKYLEVLDSFELVEAVDEARRQGQTAHRDIVLHKKGSFLEVSAVPINDDDWEEHNSVLVVLNDVTRLQRLEQVRKDFVANVSHELKTPVSTISGFAETLLAEVDQDDEVKEFSTIIYDEAQRLKRLIDRLLELSRLELAERELQRSPFDLGGLVEDSLRVMSKRYPDLAVKIILEKPARPVIIAGDADLITQVLANLLDNAINFSPDEGKITVRVEELKDEVRVSVEDQGEGIPENELSRIFERFYRVDKARSRKTGGTGLGLSIVKHLVENHGGQVGVTSQIGQGSIFFFTLPKIQIDNRVN